MKTLIAVVEENGFTTAAKRLGIAKSVCSRRITDLEGRLGVQLLNRTTRAITPTDSGKTYYQSCVDILQRIEIANNNLLDATHTISGRLRISMPLTYTETILTPILGDFIKNAPDLELIIDLTDKRVDLISGGYDAAIRIGDLDDSAYYARKIGRLTKTCCAAPAYLEQHGTPLTFSDLTKHNCLRYTNLTTGGDWVALKDGELFRKRVSGSLSSNSGELNRLLAENGGGITVLPDFIAKPGLDSGRLFPILTDYKFTHADIHIVYPQKQNMPASLRALIDHLVEAL